MKIVQIVSGLKSLTCGFERLFLERDNSYYKIGFKIHRHHFICKYEGNSDEKSLYVTFKSFDFVEKLSISLYHLK